jgi:ADP-ribose pyrophosphatase YjhB (NUDIX family)
MDDIRDNERFARAFERLADVRLNPRRHTAASALEHSHAVAARAVALARANDCSEREVRLLEALGWAHDIGKVTGTARPQSSLDVLRECGIEEPELLALVEWHDTNLPWYQSHNRGQPPSDKAWRRLASRVDVRMLCLFMVADRVDAPPGWRGNAPAVWFVAQARERSLVSGDLRLDLPDHPSEVSAGGALIRDQDGARELLVLRRRPRGYELPKGHIEWDELPEEAAAREAAEEAGIESALQVGRELGHVDYMVGDEGDRRLKRVRYFAMTGADPLRLGPLPSDTGERRWIRSSDLAELPLISDELRPFLAAALEGPDAP